ncbi:hypothetical protein N9Z27_00530 [Alphaproteobacteria bacterium]|nr:hypothetical protein [Alphaproteobacteria bacterium]
MNFQFNKYLYLTVLAIFLLVGVLGIAGVNYLVNPYGIYLSSDFSEDVFPEKPEMHNHVRMVKAHHLALQKPETVIIGSSRAQYGFDPAQMGDAYNLSIPGAALSEMHRYIEFAARMPRTKRIIFAVDFFMFNASYPVKPDFSQKRLDDIENADFKTLFSISTLGHSVQTIRKQKRGTAMKPNGQMKAEQKDRVNAKLGTRQAFLNNERSYLNSVYFPPPQKRFSFQSEDGRYSFADFSGILNLCEERGIELIVLIPPPHARQLVLIDEAGLWSQYEEWKRRMVEVNDERFALWDFSGFDRHTTEPIAEKMRYYWEGSHFKPELGTMILDRVLSKDRAVPIGVKLTSEAVVGHLKSMQRAKVAYVLRNPDDVREVREMVEKFGP